MAEAKAKASLKYADLIAKSKDQKASDEQQFVVEEAKQEIDAYILEQKKALASANKAAYMSRCAVPFNIAHVIEADKNVDDLVEGLAVLESLKKELF